MIPIADLGAAIAKFFHDLRPGSDRARARREKELAELRRKGLAPSEEEAARAAEEAEAEKKGKKGADGKSADGKGAGGKKGAALDEKGKGKKGEEAVVEVTDPLLELSPSERKVYESKQAYFVQRDTTFIADHPCLILKRGAATATEQVRYVLFVYCYSYSLVFCYLFFFFELNEDHTC